MIDIIMIIFHVQYRQPAEPATIAQKGRDTVIRLRVKELAEARGFNQSSLSRASDVSFLTIKRIFRDPHKDVAMGTMGDAPCRRPAARFVYGRGTPCGCPVGSIWSPVLYCL